MFVRFVLTSRHLLNYMVRYHRQTKPNLRAALMAYTSTITQHVVVHVIQT